MDQRLMPYLTQQEYSDVLDNANKVLRRRAPTGKILFIMLPWIALGVSLMILSSKGPSKTCEAANGMCLDGQDPITDSCCRVMCCMSGRRLQDDFEALEGLRVGSERRLRDKDLERNFLNGTRTNFDGDSTQIDGQHAERALLSRRLVVPQDCRDTTHEIGSAGNIPGECMCTQRGKSKVCDGIVSVTGPHTKDEGTRWMMGISLPIHMSGCVLPVAYMIYANCALPGLINPVLEPWVRKGLQSRYQMGSKHFQARIQVFTHPAGASVV